MSAGPGRVLKVLRERAGLTRRETARRAHVGLKYLRRVEQGQAEATPAWCGHVAGVLADELLRKAVSR